MSQREVEVHVDLGGATHRVGTLWAGMVRGREAATFQYSPSWLGNPLKFSLEPALMVGEGTFAPAERAMFASLGDSAPDTWGRRLMQRAERRRARVEQRQVRTLSEIDYLLGVADVARLGALRFREPGYAFFASHVDKRAVPPFIELPRLLGVTERVLRNEETDEDIQLLFAPGSSLGGARPKASVRDKQGQLAIAKFPKDDDDYSIERWEAIALDLARAAKIGTAHHELVAVARRPVLLSRRFDRKGVERVPFLSALALLNFRDGQQGSYPELVEALQRHGRQPRADAAEVFRRMVFNVLVSNVDDHLRNHGFLWTEQGGWELSPAYDLNPVPQDVRPRILSTCISPDEATCSLDLVRANAGFFGLADKQAAEIIGEVAVVVSNWRDAAVRREAPSAEVARMASAFEHDDLQDALKLRFAVRSASQSHDRNDPAEPCPVSDGCDGPDFE